MKICFTKKKNITKQKDQKKETKKGKFPTARVEPATIDVQSERVIY